MAALYPELEVVGVDLDPTMVELARGKHRHPNLSFVVGDIAQPVSRKARSMASSTAPFCFT